MAADPGPSGDVGAPYHLFLTRIPPKLPKEEVEAALLAELASKRIGVLAISVVPQSAWKNKGFGFVVLAGSPSASDIDAIAADLDNSIRVGGKAINVRVCQASVSGGKPTLSTGPLTNWDQPIEKITRLCAQVLHCYFARRTHQEAFKAEKLLALLSMSVAPSCCQESKPVSLWGRDVYGSLEKMLLAIGESHFGGGWSLNGTIADRNAVLTIGKARHMQGWDALRDPLPIATLLRLAACKQRLESIHTPEVCSGFSTPTACRRCSDCGSLSAMHSTEQPSCSQSEASWSLRSLYTIPATAAENTSSDCSPNLCTPNNDTEATGLSFVVSTTPGSVGACKSLQFCSRKIALADTVLWSGNKQASTSDMLRGRAAAVASPLSPQPPCNRLTKVQQAGSGGAQDDGKTSTCTCATEGISTSASAGQCESFSPWETVRTGGSPLKRSAGTSPGSRQWHRAPHSAHSSCSSCPSPGAPAQLLAPAPPSPTPPTPQEQPQQQPQQQQSNLAIPGVPHQSSARLLVCAVSSSQHAVSHIVQPPSARDLLDRCARRLKSLIRRQPAQISYAVADLASYLSEAHEVLACCHDVPYFNLEGYASAVYGSFENFLLEISRLHLNDSWRFGGGCRTGEPRIMFRTRRLTAAREILPTASNGC
ncbi:hypothetical protein Vretimale_15794 [Volvox reticuliferus]|uniref:RRM domain-containing protein n=1 Tax=Volvox reticuliferus TaxID=1737510 RepID=A0A8J4LVE6_9CHLO|nr:hypothetical protein Vretifemale_18480 [Volvox reticuliferus]GIM12447.1 hypothetical protein Vretimale_15794 [Volvox reticuliferus]